MNYLKGLEYVGKLFTALFGAGAYVFWALPWQMMTLDGLAFACLFWG